MDAFDVKNDESFKKILRTATKVCLSDGFTQSIMAQVELIGAKNKVYAKYMNRSFGFFLLAIILALGGVYALTGFEASFNGTSNIFIKAFDIYIYVLISLLSALLFYQLNNLLSYRFAQVK